MAAGLAVPTKFDPFAAANNSSPVAPSNPNVLFGSPQSYSAAATQQAGDYDKIMDAYKQLGTRTSSYSPLIPQSTSAPIFSLYNSISPQLAPDYNPSSSSTFSQYSHITPQLSASYSPSAGTTASISNLTDLATTGGYSEANKSDLRARGIAPVRSIYSTAQQGLERSKNLSGGYSPNFAASSSKMAREMSDIIGQRETDVNAQIAQNVAQNRLAAAPALGSVSAESDRMKMAREQENSQIINQINQLNEQNRLARESASASSAAEFDRMRMARESERANTMNQINQFNEQNRLTRESEDSRMRMANEQANADRANQVNQFNEQVRLQVQAANNQNLLSSAEGMKSLYGTTPALTQMFGNQVTQAAQLGQGQQEINNRNNTGGGVGGGLASTRNPNALYGRTI